VYPQSHGVDSVGYCLAIGRGKKFTEGVYEMSFSNGANVVGRVEGTR
jgi:hypothetical protein